MLHDLFGQSDVDVTNILLPKERKELLRNLANLWGGMTGSPQCYSVHAGLDRNDSEGKNRENNLVLYANTAELRKGILVYHNYGWDPATKVIDPESHKRFLKDLEYFLKFSEYPQTEENVASFEGFFYNQNPRVYDDFDGLKEAVCRAGFPKIGENLCLAERQESFVREEVALSLKPGTILTSEKYWQGPVFLKIRKNPTQNIGNYVLCDSV